MEQLKEWGLDLLFPRRCPLCGKISADVCGDCKKKIVYVRQPCCRQCSKPLSDGTQGYCASCRAFPYAYEQGRALCVYADPVKESIHAIKYRNRREYLDFYAGEIAVRLGDQIRRWDPEVLVPVPMHPLARRERGYNQAELLAKKLEKELGIPARSLLKKVKKTAEQKELDHRQRRANLKGAFAMSGGPLDFKRILLVDDVYTTGSTVHEAAETLRSAGAEHIYFVTICIVPENS